MKLIDKDALLAEIERLVNNYDKALDYEAALEDVRNFIDSIQEEPKKCMYTKDNYTDNDRKTLCEGCEEKCEFNQVKESAILQHKEEMCKENGDSLTQEPVSEELEKELSAYVNSKEYTNSIGTSGLLLIARHFANWQKEKEYTCYEEAFEDGAKWKKEQMMAKAIDGDITFDYYGDDDKTYGCIAHDSFCLEDFGLKDRDKVKVIVIKED